jgi:hypothetical protein
LPVKANETIEAIQKGIQIMIEYILSHVIDIIALSLIVYYGFYLKNKVDALELLIESYDKWHIEREGINRRLLEVDLSSIRNRIDRLYYERIICLQNEQRICRKDQKICEKGES